MPKRKLATTEASKEGPKSKKTGKNQSTSEEGPKSKKAVKKQSTGGSSSKFELKSYLQDEGWLEALKEEFDKSYFKNIESQLEKDYKQLDIFPPKELIFNAFNKTPIKKVRVVILGQDPYHDDGQAMGMSFSVPDGVALPPSLKNIYKELVNDMDIKNFTAIPVSGCLEKWAERGVLLINATLTVEAHKPNSHKSYGWQTFTDAVIKVISDTCSDVVFVLWGGFAHKKEKLINASKHAVIKTAHPSPLSFNKWLGCKCFSQVNKELGKRGKGEIDWTV